MVYFLSFTSVVGRHDARFRGTKGAGTLGGKDDGVLTTSMVGCGRPNDSAGVDLRIVDTEVTEHFSAMAYLPYGSGGSTGI